MLQKIKHKWKSLSIINQSIIVYCISFLFIVGGVLGFYTWILSNTSKSETESVLEAKWNLAKQNLDSTIQKVEEYSRLIGYSTEIQDYLKKQNKSGENRQLESPMISILMGNSWIDSIYIYSKNGRYYGATNTTWKAKGTADIQKAFWYDEVMENKSTSVICINGGGFLKTDSLPYMSVISLIKNPNTFTTEGIMIFNISIEKVFQNIDKTGVSYALINSEGEKFYTSGVLLEEFYEPMSKVKSIGISDLKMFTAVETVHVEATRRIMLIYTVFILLIIVAAIAFFTYHNSRSVVTPLYRILHKMDKGTLETIHVREYNKDMVKFQEGYNILIDKINQLLERIDENEKKKRQYELNILNAQVRPHFLYNTFDSVCALALMGKTKDVYRLMQALGTYYRTSLHKGDEEITLKEEITIIKNYIIIQKYRFDDFFEMEYDIDENLLQIPVLKLILQPFVENSIYHALKPIGGGKISIKAEQAGEDILITVSDTGVGMSQDKIQRILKGEIVQEEKSFGVHGTIERINLFYQIDHSVEIDSEEGKGTTIRIHIPFQKNKEGKVIL